MLRKKKTVLGYKQKTLNNSKILINAIWTKPKQK